MTRPYRLHTVDVWSHPVFAGDVDMVGRWLWIIDHAEWRDGRHVPRGCIQTSLRALGEKWAWPEARVRRFLRLLVEHKMVEITGCGRYHAGQVVRVVNYDRYQRRNRGTHCDATADAMPDATADAMPDATADAMPDATADAMPAGATLRENTRSVNSDATADAMPDATADAMPDATADAMPDAMPDATADAMATQSRYPYTRVSLEQGLGINSSPQPPTRGEPAGAGAMSATCSVDGGVLRLAFAKPPAQPVRDRLRHAGWRWQRGRMGSIDWQEGHWYAQPSSAAIGALTALGIDVPAEGPPVPHPPYEPPVRIPPVSATNSLEPLGMMRLLSRARQLAAGTMWQEPLRSATAHCVDIGSGYRLVLAMESRSERLAERFCDWVLGLADEDGLWPELQQVELVAPQVSADAEATA